MVKQAQQQQKSAGLVLGKEIIQREYYNVIDGVIVSVVEP
jgi:hypothetical protein